METVSEATLAVKVTAKMETTLAKDKYTRGQQQNLLTMAFVGKQGKCAGYDDDLWIGGKAGIMSVINECAEELQSLLVTRRDDGEGRVVMADTIKFIRVDKLREKTFGIVATRPPKAIWRNSAIACKDMLPNQEFPDLKFYLKWRKDEKKLCIRGIFMGEEYNLDSPNLNTEKAGRITEVFEGENSLEIFFEKKRFQLIEKEAARRLGRYSANDDGKGKVKATKTPAERLTIAEMGGKIATDFTQINIKIREIVMKKLALEWLPEEGTWAYLFDTKDGKVGVGTLLHIEKEE